MRILITGAAGMLGSAVVPELVRMGHAVVASDIDLSVRRPWGDRGPTLGHLDVRDAGSVRAAVDELSPDLVLHLAAETSLELCELEPDHAVVTNALGTKHVALACQRADVPLVYISTAGVFDGEKAEPYTEFDTPNPINLYGRTKLDGERIVESLLSRYYIVRAGWMVGGGSGKDHKFVARILGQLDEGRTQLHAVVDKLGTPTYAPDFAYCLTQLIETGSYGLYHMAGKGRGSRFDVAAKILDVLGRTDVELVAVESDFFAEEFFASRPHSEIMRNQVLELSGLDRMRPWEVALEDYLRTFFPDHLRSGLAAPVT